MAVYSREEIARMKDELRKDLEALERVERLLESRNGANHAESGLVPPPTQRRIQLPPDNSDEQPMVLGVKSLCIEGLKRAGVLGAAPKDLLIFSKAQGYVFSSDTNGAASITTALSRLVSAGKVHRVNGRYFWIGGDAE